MDLVYFVLISLKGISFQSMCRACGRCLYYMYAVWIPNIYIYIYIYMMYVLIYESNFCKLIHEGAKAQDD